MFPLLLLPWLIWGIVSVLPATEPDSTKTTTEDATLAEPAQPHETPGANCFWIIIDPKTRAWRMHF